MTIKEALETIDILRKGNKVSEEMKIKWLSRLDARAHREVFLTHRCIEPGTEAFDGYTVGTPQEQELMIPFPYDEVYEYYLAMKVDETESESLKYNISAEKFNNAYTAFMDRYNKTHTPIYGGSQFYF